MTMRLLPEREHLGWTPYAWLVYVVPFVAYPFLDRAHTDRIAPALAATAVFFVLYFRGYWEKGARLLAIIGALTLLGVLFLPINPGAGTFFIYAASFAGGVGEPKRAFLVIGGIVAALLIEVRLLDLSFFSWWWAALFSLLVGGVNVHFAQVRRSNARLRLAQDEIEHLAKVAERERIARDLHDLLGHTLSLIIIKSELASKLADRDPQRARDEIRDVERISRKALAEVRQAVRGYRRGGLQSELEAAKEMLRAASIAVNAELDAVRLPPSHEAILALAMREGVTNVVRHSHASNCAIRLERQDAQIRLMISDDGRGGAQPSGLGLTGMLERIAALGGTVARDGSRGTTLTITLPAIASAGEPTLVRSA